MQATGFFLSHAELNSQKKHADIGAMMCCYEKEKKSVLDCACLGVDQIYEELLCTAYIRNILLLTLEIYTHNYKTCCNLIKGKMRNTRENLFFFSISSYIT